MEADKRPDKRTRIQKANRQIILAAALDVFSAYGFRGSTLDQIAEKSGLSKPNLLYYFPHKADIYRAVLEETLAAWLEPLTELDSAGDPFEEIRTYMLRKLKMARDRPEESRLFANEILNGAPAIKSFLTSKLKDLVDEKSAVIQSWIDAGRLKAVSPQHLIFMIWATTQHYADFDVQVRAVLGGETGGADPFEDAEKTLLSVILDGLRPD